MSETQKQSSSPRSPFRKKRWIAFGASTLFVGVFFLYAFIRGTLADTVEKNPTNVSQGVLTQLFQNAQGQKIVRGALIIEASPEKVWKTITDYPKFPEVFSNMKELKVVKEEGGTSQIQGLAHTFLGDYPFEITVKHQSSEKEFKASWDQATDLLKVNRGSWTLTPIENQTLVVYTLELEVKSFPKFLVRDFLLTQLKPTLLAVKTIVSQP